MIRIKSLQSSKLIITDAGIKLIPGQVVAVNSLSPQTENLIAMGYVAKLEDGQTTELPKTNEQAESPLPVSETGSLVPKEYENLHMQEALEFIAKVTNPQVLRAILKEEKRKTVIENINKRLGEIEK